MIDNKIIKVLDQQEYIRRTTGRVVSVSDNNAVVLVKLRDSDTQINLLNKTGEYLSVGDGVWIHYWKEISDGYVAIKDGLSVDYNFSSAVQHDPPIDIETHIKNSYLLNEEQSEYITSYTYDVDDDYETIDFTNVSLGSISKGAYIPAIDEHEAWPQYCYYFYSSDCPAYNGVTLHFNWIPRFYNNREVGYGAIAEDTQNDLYVYNHIQIPVYTEVWDSTLERNRYIMETRTIQLEQGIETRDGVTLYCIQMTISQSMLRPKQVIGTLASSVSSYPDISKYGFILFLYEGGDYTGLYARSELEPLIYGCMAHGVYQNDNGNWCLKGGSNSVGAFVEIPAAITNNRVNIHEGEVTQTKERSEVI